MRQLDSQSGSTDMNREAILERLKCLHPKDHAKKAWFEVNVYLRPEDTRLNALSDGGWDYLTSDILNSDLDFWLIDSSDDFLVWATPQFLKLILENPHSELSEMLVRKFCPSHIDRAPHRERMNQLKAKYDQLQVDVIVDTLSYYFTESRNSSIGKTPNTENEWWTKNFDQEVQEVLHFWRTEGQGS